MKPEDVQVDPRLSWHDVGCVKRYGAESKAVCECEARIMQDTTARGKREKRKPDWKRWGVTFLIILGSYLLIDWITYALTGRITETNYPQWLQGYLTGTILWMRHR